MKELLSGRNPEIKTYLIREATNHAFSYACFGGQIDVIYWIREIVPEINVLGEYCFNFSWACLKGQLEVIRLLKAWAPEIDINYNNGEAFYYGCFGESFAIVRQLLEWCPNINIYTREKAAIQSLCYSNNFDIISFIIEQRGSIDFSGISLDGVQDRRIRNMILGIVAEDIEWLSSPKSALVTEQPIECPICKTELEQYIETPCKHKYCVHCITEWLNCNTNCPYCRQNII